MDLRSLIKKRTSPIIESNKFKAPGWTPLFINASEIILEIGGVLQHGAMHKLFALMHRLMEE